MVTPRRPRGQRPQNPPIVGTPDGRTSDEQARLIRGELETIAGNPDCIGLTADAVWRWAQAHPNSELHKHFTWDVQEAAIKCWQNEARKVIASVRYVIVPQEGEEPVRLRSIVSLKTTDQRDEPVQYNGYIDRRAMLRRTETRNRFITRARSELASWVHRYCDVPELAELREAITEALAE